MSLVGSPLNARVLQALKNGPISLSDLRQEAGLPPPTTLRMHLRALTDLNVLERRRKTEFPNPVEYELTGVGTDLLGVLAALENWLRQSPQGELRLGSSAAKSSTKAAVEGWSAGIVRALSSRPLALTELSRLINDLSYPSLERRLGAMRAAGLIDRGSANGRGRPYEVTRWLRLATVPLSAAARWERKHMREQSPPIRRLDIEAAFLLVLPLVSLSDGRSGSCRLVVDTSSSSQHRQAGVLVKVERGAISTCVTRLEGHVDSSVSGSASAWMNAASHGRPSNLQLVGNRGLAVALVEGIHQALLAPQMQG